MDNLLQKQLISILDAIAGGVTAQDKTGKLIYANLPAAHLMGFSSVELLLAAPIDQILQQFEVFDTKRQPFPLSQLPGRLAMQGLPTSPVMLGFRIRATGEEYWSQVDAKPVLDTDGSIAFIVNTFHDVTPENMTRLALEASQKRFAYLAQASEMLAASLDYEKTLANVTQLATPMIADWCSIDFINGGNQLRRLAVAHVDPEKVKWAYELAERYPPSMDAPTGVPNVIRTGKSEYYPLITDDMLVAAANDDSEMLKILREVGYRSVLIVPVVARERVFGALTLVTTTESGRDLTADDVSLAEELGRRAGTAVENAILFRDAQNELRQRREAEAALQTSVQQLQLITDGLPALVSYIDANQCYHFVNRTYEEWFGCSKAEIYGKSMREILGDDAYQKLQPYVETAMSGKTAQFETWVNYKGAGRRYIDAAYIPDFDEQQQVRGFFVLVNDMTERKRGEERALQLQNLTVLLSQSLTLEQVASVIINEGLAIMGSDTGAIYLMSEDGQSLQLAGSKNTVKIDEYATIPVTMSGPLIDAIREQKPVWLETEEEYLRRYPNLADVVRGRIKTSMCLPFKVNSRVIGGISASFLQQKNLIEEEKALFMAIAQQCGQALERAHLYDAERKARRESEDGQRRFAYLSQASALLASSLDYETTLRNVTLLAVPTIGDWCAVDLLTEERQLERLAVAHVNPEKIKWAYEVHKRYPPNLDSPRGMAQVLRSGTSEYYPHVSEELLVLSAGGDLERLQMIRDVGFRSAMVVPIISRGRIFGALTLVTTTESGRDLTADDLAVAEELGRRAGIAIENAKLYRAAHVERERLQVTLTSIGDGVIVTDDQGRVTFLNPVAQNLTGWIQEEAAGQPLSSVFNIVNEYTRELVESPVDKVLREGVIVGLANHTILINKDGSELSIDDSGAPIRDNDGNLVGVVLVFRDITERREIERQKEEVLEQERLARREAERANELKLRFLAMISHELRTPLASIKGFTTTLLATDVSFDVEEQRSFLSIINDEADRLRNLIEQLLDLSSLQAGTLNINPERQTMTAILDHARAQLVTLTPEHPLTVNIPDHLPLVYADPQRLAQVLVNLVGNATKYCPTGTPITVNAGLENGHIRVDVTDTGPGIPLEVRPYIFEAFRRVEDKSLRLKGAGLGLAICKGLIEKHRGAIWIDEQYHGGTKMSFILPVIEK